MPDLADISDAPIQMITDDGISRARVAVENMPVGGSGICVSCGEHTKRLVTGICAPCRDFLARQYVMKI